MPDIIRDKSQGKPELYQNISLYSADFINLFENSALGGIWTRNPHIIRTASLQTELSCQADVTQYSIFKYLWNNIMVTVMNLVRQRQGPSFNSSGVAGIIVTGSTFI